MAYNRKNKLYFILAVQNTYQLHKQDGVSTRYVYKTYIKPVFHISIATLYAYLNVRAEHELKQLNKEKDNEKHNSKYKQASMDFLSE